MSTDSFFDREVYGSSNREFRQLQTYLIRQLLAVILITLAYQNLVFVRYSIVNQWLSVTVSKENITPKISLIIISLEQKSIILTEDIHFRQESPKSQITTRVIIQNNNRHIFMTQSHK